MKFTAKAGRDVHVKSIHEGRKFACELCSKTFVTITNHKIHMNKVHKTPRKKTWTELTVYEPRI